MTYADIILPVPLEGLFTYSVPAAMEAGVRFGVRVAVPFGTKTTHVGIVIRTHGDKPEGISVRDIQKVLDREPVLTETQYRLWQWIADYYMSPIGEVYKAALPSGLKAEEGYRPRTETYVRLRPELRSSRALRVAMDILARADRQRAALAAYLQLSGWAAVADGGSEENVTEVSRDELMNSSHANISAIKALETRGFIETYRREVGRLNTGGEPDYAKMKQLGEAQQQAYNAVLFSLLKKNVTLLHGVTSSGKTEIYIHLIKQAIDSGRQVLYLLPEIALTVQIMERLRRVFGGRIGIYHSRYSDAERVEIWRKQLSPAPFDIILGARSAVLLPFTRLGLVIVDEEHDSSYKQQEPAPRYNGRNVAMMLAMMHGAKSLLGSATPSVETYYKAVTGKFGLVEMPVRYEGLKMPEVEIIDMKDARRKHEVNGFFSNALLTVCRESLKAGEQVILFQNRRGYAPMVTCRQCGWVPKCENCDVSLTYHKHVGTLSCHYCGYSMSLPTVCPACGQATIEIVGFGTERVEDNITELFPDSRIARMDLDTTRNKNSYEKIIEDFSARKSDILVGTQMVTKGLDFAGVSTVGILNADTMINFPDFLSHERAFNMMEQVAGRAGRKGKQGRVLIQTYNPDNPVIRFVVGHDYKGFYADEIGERERYCYPPFSKIINIYLKHRDDAVVGEMAVRMSNMMRQVFKHRVLGPEAPAVRRIQNLYIRQIVLKMENTASMSKVKQILRLIYENMLKVDSRMKSVFLYFDVDPV